MGSQRVRRGHGDDMGGASQLSRAVYMAQGAKPTPRGKMSREFNSPMPDPKARGGTIAHVGSDGAPTIYTESEGSRRGGKGRRVK